jgi:hypothetical protein
MITKFSSLVTTMLMLSASTTYVNAQVEVITMAVANTKESTRTIIVSAVAGSKVTINNTTHDFVGDNESHAFVVDVSTGGNIIITATDFSSITSLNISNCAVIELNVKGNTALKKLVASNNSLSTLDLSGITSLTYLNLSNVFGTGLLTDLNISGCTGLEDLFLSGTPLETLNISDTNFTNLFLSGFTKLTSLDVSGCNSLMWMLCNNTSLTTLDVSGLSALRGLKCDNTPLTSLDISDCDDLELLYCNDTFLTTLDVSGFSALSVLDCSNTPLTSLNISGCNALEELYCNDTFLTTLDVSGFSTLSVLNCSNSSLKDLNVSRCDDLVELYADNQNIVVNVPFNYNNSGIEIYFNGEPYLIKTNDFSIPTKIAAGTDFSGNITVVRADDNRARYTVTFVATDGVSINRNYYNEVIDGYSLQFITTLDNKYADYELTVLVNGEKLAPTLSSNIYMIDNIRSNKVVTFILNASGNNPTDNSILNVASVSSINGEIIVESPSTAKIQIANISGRVIYSDTAAGTTKVSVAAGIYVVTINGKSAKVVVR